MSRIPNIYRDIGPIRGVPLNWRDDVTGELPAAIGRQFRVEIAIRELVIGELVRFK